MPKPAKAGVGMPPTLFLEGANNWFSSEKVGGDETVNLVKAGANRFA